MATFTVTTLVDENDVGATEATPGGAGLSLREALALANANADADTIVFDASLAAGTLTLTNGELSIATDVTINGDTDGDQNADITVSGNLASRVFNVNGGAAPAITASLNALVIRDGSEPTLGGAGIRVDTDTLIVTNSTITANVAGNGGGAGILNYGSATLINTVVSDNQAGPGTGGGIFNRGTLDIIGSTLSGNQAGYQGGAIFNYLSGVTLTDSTVTGNSASYGGGILNKVGSVELTNSTVVGNQANAGGGIFNTGGVVTATLTLTNSTVTGNYASETLIDSGGGILNIDSTSATTLINSIVAGNDAAAGDGDVAGVGTLTLSGGNIVGGTRTIDGATQQTGIALTDIFASVTNNPDTNVLSGTLGTNGGPVQTVAINASAANPALDAGDDGLAPATDARNFSRDDVAGAANNGTNVSDLGAFEASHSLVVTTADDVVDATDGLLSLREALALADANAGADTITFDVALGIVEVFGTALTIASDVTIEGDSDSDGDADITIHAFGSARVLDVTAGTSTLQHLTVTGGFAAGEDGGGIRIAAGASLTLADVDVVGNLADGDGGGIHNAGTLTLTNTVVGFNAGDVGGGIHNAGTMTLTNSAVVQNQATHGGGISTEAGSDATMTNVVLSGNYTALGGDGGGINNVGTMTLVNGTLAGNSAAFGGGIFNIGDLTVTSSTLSGNDAGQGGGIVSSGAGSSLTLTNSIVAGNEATTGADLNGSPHLLVGGNIVGDTLSLDGVTQQSGLALTDIFAQVGINPYTGVTSGLLADNSGPLPTIGIKDGGAAHNTGSDTALPPDTQDLNHDLNTGEPLPLDARGFARIADAHVDLGALELQPGQSFEVTTLADELDSSDPNATLTDFGGLGDLSLREALVLAQQDKASYDTITFAAGLTGGSNPGIDDGVLTLATGELAIEGNVTIDGDVNHDGAPDITIDADHSSAALHAFSGVITLNGLTVEHGFAGYGAGISVGAYIYGSYADVTVSNSIIRDNAAYGAYGDGGGLSVDTGSALRLINSTVSGNLGDIGGGIAVNDGATLTAVNSTISGNSVAGLSGYGGGIAVNGGGRATLVSSTISGNTGVYGGGIYNAGGLTLINTTLANNVADYGGGLYMNDCGCGVADVISSTISGNFAGIGGGIYLANGTIYLTNSIVAGNGAGYADPDISIVAGDLYFAGTNILSQTLPGAPGGYVHEANLANIFATVTTIDPTPVDGDEFDAGVLANNGGRVQTIAIKVHGAAYNEGDNAELPADLADLDGDSDTIEILPFDARGELRVFGVKVDVGAYEILNTPPVQHVNTGLTLDEGASATITAGVLDFDDAEDVDSAIVYTITTAPTVGAVLLNGTPLGLGGTFTQDDINNNRVSYAHDDSETIADSFGFSVSDGFSTVSGQNFAFTITPVDDTPPVQAANTGLSLDEGASAGITALQLDYNDAAEPPENVTYTITTAVAVGTLLLNGGALGLGGTFTQDDIDNGRLSYAHDGGETTAASFGFSVTDGINPLAGQSFAISINAVNDVPVNTLPGAQSLEANHSLAITGISVADPDAFGGSMSATLSVEHGTLNVAALGGAVVGGSGTDTVSITGTLAAINATLTGSNVLYTPVTDYFDNDLLTMVTNDGGNTGIGGPLSDTDTVAIDLHTHLFGTPGNDSFVLGLLPPGDIRIDALGGFGDSITFNFRLVDATVRYVGNTIVIDGPARHLVLTGFEQYVFTDGTVDNNDGNPLVDDLFYYSRNNDVWNAHVDADAHFASFGWHENRDPSAFFSVSTYLSAYPDVAATGINPLQHFHSIGWQEGRVPSIAFDPQHYLAANPDVAAAHVDPLEHYLLFGHQEGRTPFAPSELIAANGFDYVYYLQRNADVAAAHVDPFAHFMTVGWTEGRNPNGLFDVNGYLATYGDVAASHVNPLTHYNQFGWPEGRDPSLGFDTTSYLSAYPDVAAAHVNPLTHFLQFGIHEGRSPFADGVWG